VGSGIPGENSGAVRGVEAKPERRHHGRVVYERGRHLHVLIWFSWTAGLRTRVDTWGPPPLEKMTRLFFEMNAADIDTRIADEGRVPLVPLVFPHELTEDGPVMQDERVRVTAALVDHAPVTPAFGYRFDCPD